MLDPMEKFGQEIRDLLGEEPPEETQRQVRKRLGKVEIPEKRQSLRLVPLASAALALIGVTALLLTWWVAESPAPHFPALIDANQATADGVYRAPAKEPLMLRFVDGSQVELAAQAAGQIAYPDRKTVAMTVEQGQLQAHIQTSTGVSWQFRAGLFRVMVTGTALAIDWQPAAQRIQVNVSEGQVKVVGGSLGEEGITVRTGDRLDASPQGFSLNRIIDHSSPKGTTSMLSPVKPEPAPAPALPKIKKTAPRKTKTRQDPDRWQWLAQAGYFDRAMVAVDRAGVEKLVGSLPANRLVLLADSARYTGQTRLARRALLMLRKRFPLSGEAKLASFRLARIAIDLEKDHGKAAHWFKTYLSQNPQGKLAEDARGRLCEALLLAGKMNAARAAAADYLQRYPQGAYAALARLAIQDP